MHKWSWNHWTLSLTLPSLFSTESRTLWKPRKKFLNLNVKGKINFLLYGSQSAISKSLNHEIAKFVISYILETDPFDRPLFCPNQWFLDGLFLDMYL